MTIAEARATIGKAGQLQGSCIDNSNGQEDCKAISPLLDAPDVPTLIDKQFWQTINACHMRSPYCHERALPAA